MRKGKYRYLVVVAALITVVSYASAQITEPDGETEERVKYFGFDIGPKYDHYVSRQVAGPSYSPNVEVVKDIGATAGMTAGLFMDNKYIVEVGIYRNNYKAKLDFTSPQGNIFFKSTIVNTFSSYSIPVRVGSRIFNHSPGSLFFFQVGVTTLLNARLDFDQPKTSVLDEKTVDNVVVDNMDYIITNNQLDGKVMSLDVGLVYNQVLRKNLFFTSVLSARLGIGGENRFSTIHNTRNEDNTEDVIGVTNEVQTNGSGLNLTLGFRYFMF